MVFVSYFQAKFEHISKKSDIVLFWKKGESQMAKRPKRKSGHYVYTPYITLRNGRRLYAWQKGKKAFRFFVYDNWCITTKSISISTGLQSYRFFIVLILDSHLSSENLSIQRQFINCSISYVWIDLLVFYTSFMHSQNYPRLVSVHLISLAKATNL